MGVNPLLALFQMLSYSESQGVDCKLHLYGNALIHTARNKALANVRDDATHVLFVDDDMLPSKEALVRLLSHKLPVVSALCTTRVPPVTLACKYYDRESNQWLVMDKIHLDKVVSGNLGVGTAFLLMNAETVDKLIAYYLSANDWLQHNALMLNQLAVRSETREKYRLRMSKVRAARWERDKYLLVFDYPVGSDGLQLGEDIGLAQKLFRLDIPVAIDGGLCVGHVGEYPYGIWDILAQEEKEERGRPDADSALIGGPQNFNPAAAFVPGGLDLMKPFLKEQGP